MCSEPDDLMSHQMCTCTFHPLPPAAFTLSAMAEFLTLPACFPYRVQSARISRLYRAAR